MKKRSKHSQHFVVCISNEGYPASLESRKIYQVIEDEKATKKHLLRIIDDSGEDYLYPEDFFIPIELPKPVEKAIRLAS
jgi:hypothetical protein